MSGRYESLPARDDDLEADQVVTEVKDVESAPNRVFRRAATIMLSVLVVAAVTVAALTQSGTGFSTSSSKSPMNLLQQTGVRAPDPPAFVTDAPTAQPTHNPTEFPTEEPTQPPTKKPTHAPTTSAPTEEISHTVAPTDQGVPTEHPTHSPSFSPSSEPSFEPTFKPTHSPTSEPSERPTATPSWFVSFPRLVFFPSFFSL